MKRKETDLERADGVAKKYMVYRVVLSIIGFIVGLVLWTVLSLMFK